MKFALIHRIPGRARFRAERSFGLRTANTLADGLYGIEGMEGVRVNPRVGSVNYSSNSAQTLIKEKLYNIWYYRR